MLLNCSLSRSLQLVRAVRKPVGCVIWPLAWMILTLRWLIWHGVACEGIRIDPFTGKRFTFLTIPTACRWRFISSNPCQSAPGPVTCRAISQRHYQDDDARYCAHPTPLSSVLVAFSGGLDSTVLLHQLVCWRERDPTLQRGPSIFTMA